MFLVDTNVISEVAPGQAAASPGLVDWMDRNSARLFTSVITIAEVEAGIAKLRRRGSYRRAEQLADWITSVLQRYGNYVLPFDTPVQRAQGLLSDKAVGQGRDPGFADVAIAATAHVHGLTVLTRNIRHFANLGIPVANPFDQLPD